MIRLDPIFGCYLFEGTLDREGYPLDRGRRVHRTAYAERYGPIPEGKELDHVCRRRNCVRPEHLEPVTRSENERRKSWRRRSKRKHCPAGHDYYTHGRLTKEGGRVCLACAPPVLEWTTEWAAAGPTDFETALTDLRDMSLAGRREMYRADLAREDDPEAA